MTQQDKINSILAAIQTDANIIILIRALVTNNLPIVSDAQLNAMLAALGLPNS